MFTRNQILPRSRVMEVSLDRSVSVVVVLRPFGVDIYHNLSIGSDLIPNSTLNTWIYISYIIAKYNSIYIINIIWGAV